MQMQVWLHRLFCFSYGIQQWLIRRFTHSGLLVAIGLGIAAGVGLDTNQSLAYQVFTFLLALLLIAIAFSLAFRFRFRATRNLPRFGTVGTQLQYRIVIHNLTRQPQIGLKLLENFADPRPSLAEFLGTREPNAEKQTALDRTLGYYRWIWLIGRKKRAIANPIDLPPLRPHRSTEVVMELTPTHRGVIHFQGLTVFRPDPFGLFNACQAIALPQSLLVLPKLYPLPPIQLPGLHQYQSGGVALASTVGESEEFRSLRDYRPGDPLRKIHWKSWAKVGKPIVKEEQDEFFVRHALILDTFQSSAYSPVLEAAVSVAASLACEVQTQESLLDLMFVGTSAYCFTFGRGLSHTDQMLEILASVVACPDKSFDHLTPLILNRADLLSGCICVFLTWDEPRQTLVSHLRSLQIPTLVLVITDTQQKRDDFKPGPMSDEPDRFHVLSLDNLQAGLMNL